jgi:type II secretory pathway pseudopilin PulG
MNKSYTLIEVLMAVSIFTIIIAAPTGFLVGSLKGQQKALASQKLLDNTSYTLEYISRSLRMAKKELSTEPTTACLFEDSTILYGYNYQITREGTGLKFINYKEECQEFFLEDSRLKESKNGAKNYLTSEDLEITSLKFKLSGQAQTDTDQPRVTLFLEIKGGKDLKDELRPLIKIQTTISQRNLDVPY